MIGKLKIVFGIGLIITMLGLGIISLIEHQYKPFALGILYSIANIIIFLL